MLYRLSYTSKMKFSLSKLLYTIFGKFAIGKFEKNRKNVIAMQNFVTIYKLANS